MTNRHNCARHAHALPSLSELHAFAAAARLGSYSLAARELYVTQGGISRAIARLEEHLGFALCCPQRPGPRPRPVLTRIRGRRTPPAAPVGATP